MFKSSIGLDKYQISIDHKCDHKFGSILYALKFLMSDSRFRIVIEQLSEDLLILNLKLKIIRIADVLRRMGISPLMVKEFGIIVS